GIENLTGGDGGDLFQIASVPGPLVIQGGGGGNRFQVGYPDPSASRTLENILGPLTLDGGGGAHTPTVNDRGDASPLSGTLTGTSLAGLGMVHGLNYGSFPRVNVLLGSHVGDFTLDRTAENAVTTVFTGGPGVQFSVLGIGGPTTLYMPNG